LNHESSAVAQADSHLPPMMEDQVQSQASLHGIYGEQSGI